MRHRSLGPLAILLLSIMALAHPAAAAEETSVDEPSPLWRALAFATPGTTLLAVTDWDALKAAHGLDILDSSLPEDLRFEGMDRITQEEAVFSGFGLSRFLGHADAWGWDSTDLAWDAQLFGSGSPVYILRFRDDLDLDPFLERLDEYGFDSRQRGDVTIRGHDFDPGSEWARTTELAIVNTAFLPDGRTVLMSGSPEALEAALDAATGGDGVVADATSPAGQVAGALGDPASAAIDIGPERCLTFSQASEPNAELVAEVGPLSRWQALGVGTYVSDTGTSTARLALVAPDAPTAEAETEGRARLLRDGLSITSGEAYRDAFFTVSGADSDGATISIDLQPVEDRSRAVARAMFTADLLAARCDPA